MVAVNVFRESRQSYQLSGGKSVQPSTSSFGVAHISLIRSEGPKYLKVKFQCIAGWPDPQKSFWLLVKSFRQTVGLHVAENCFNILQPNVGMEFEHALPTWEPRSVIAIAGNRCT